MRESGSGKVLKNKEYVAQRSKKGEKKKNSKAHV